MREEMDSVVGRGGRSPGTEDRSEMPYAEAVVHEVQRRANVAHLAISHTTLRDVEIGTAFLFKKCLENGNPTTLDKKISQAASSFRKGRQ